MVSFFLLRLSLGALYLYAGITKLLNPEWSSAGYLAGAKQFTGFFQWLASPQIVFCVDFMNQWGLTLLGVSLLLGAGVRWSSKLGAALMFLYYLPLGFPFPNEHAFLVDEHIVYAFALLYLGFSKAGNVGGIYGWIAPMKRFKKAKLLKTLLE